MRTLKFKSIALVSMIFILLIAAVGCSNNKDDKNQSESETRTVKTVKGNIEVPKNPKRVVVNYFEGDLLSLGVKPIATGTVFKGAAFENETKDVKIVEKWEAEEVMELDPDLIIVITEEQYDEFNKIAPTIFVPFTEISAEERLTLLGEVFGKEKVAEKVISDFENKVEESKNKINEAGVLDKTFTLAEAPEKGNVTVYGNKWGRGGNILYDYLDLKAPEPIEKDIIDGDQNREVSFEALPEYCGDFVIQSLWEGSDPLKDNKVWNNIPAIKEGRLIKTDGNLFYYMDFYSMNGQLDLLVNEILEKAKN